MPKMLSINEEKIVCTPKTMKVNATIEFLISFNERPNSFNGTSSKYGPNLAVFIARIQLFLRHVFIASLPCLIEHVKVLSRSKQQTQFFVKFFNSPFSFS